MNYLITGGTGTLGRELIRQIFSSYHDTRPKITVLSRDELKQKELLNDFQGYNLKCVLGDVSQSDDVYAAVSGKDVVIHTAALKHVDTGEKNVNAFIRTNIIGSSNVVEATKIHKTPYVVFSSTDKAVDPINVYGQTKAIAERMFLNANDGSRGRYSVFRWGNILGSRGSVIYSFVDSLLRENKIYITDVDMTRFFITIEKAAAFMLSQYTVSSLTEPTIPRMKGSAVLDVADAIAQILKKHDYTMSCVGSRPGEKIHEFLRSIHSEDPLSSEHCERHTTQELITMIEPIVKEYLFK